MKRVLFILAFVLILGSSFCGNSLMNTMAEEPAGPKMVTYYKSIEIEKGDTLWDIAEEYAPGTGLTTVQYVQQLKQMNHLGEDTIHTGCHLIVMYKASEESISLAQR